MAGIDFDTAQARADGVPDSAIAEFLASKAGFDLAAARADKVPDSAIVDFLAPTAAKAAPTPTPPVDEQSKPSGTLSGIVKGVGQGLIETAGRAVSGMGAAYQTAAEGGVAFEGAKQEAVRRQSDIMDKIDAGADMREFKDLGQLDRLFAREYQVSDADRRAKVRERIGGEIAALPSLLDTPAGKVGMAVGELGQKVSGAGKDVQDYAQKAVPLTEEEQGRFSVKTAKVVTGLAAYIGAAAAGGLPAMIGYGGIEAMGQTFEDAKSKGSSDEEAAKAAFINGVVQGGMNAIPMHQAMVAMDAIPRAFRGEFIKTATEVVKSSVALLTFSQLAHLAENVVAKNTYDPERPVTQGLGEDLGPTAVAGAIIPIAGGGARGAVNAVARRVRPTPQEVAAPIVDSSSVSEAIDRAREIVDRPAIEEQAVQAAEFGNRGEQDQAAILRLFGGLNEGQVERAADGAWHYRDASDQTYQLQPWDGRPREGTIPAALVAAQQRHYDQLGVRVVYFEDNARIPFDGAVDPAQPNTIFLSNKTQRNAAQVAGHEFTHVLEDTRLPDGTSLADILHQQVAAGMTAEGRAYAERLFGPTAPKREAFGEGAEGDSFHADAVTRHLVRELGADIGGEAPKFQTFIPRVVDAVQSRFGETVAREVLGRLIAGIQKAMATLREFFFKPEDMAEYGNPPTESQKWVSNLTDIHGTLAQMYAERFGRPAELAAPRAREALPAPEARQALPYYPGGPSSPPGPPRPESPPIITPPPTPQRLLPAPAVVTPPPRPVVTPENVFSPTTYGAPREAGPIPAAAVEIRQELPKAAAPEPAPPVAPPTPKVEPVQILQPEAVVDTQLAKEQARIKAMREKNGTAAEAARTAPEPPTVAAEQHVSEFESAVRAERERLWTEDMPGRKRGKAFNERAVDEMARETVMRQEAAEAIDNAIRVYGLPSDALHEVARYYRREKGEAPAEALDRAASRWFDQKEIEAARIFGVGEDVLNHDFLKPEGGDPVLREMYERINEHYTAGHVDHDAIPFESQPVPQDAGDRGAAARAEGREGGEAGGGPRSRSADADPDAGAAGPVPEGRKPGVDPAFSPRRRTDTEPPGPTLIETRKATPDELAARQRVQDKELAEANMRGRKVAGRPQESAGDLALFGGDRQKPLFSPRVVGAETYTDAQRQAAERVRGTDRRSLGEIISEWREDLGKKLVREVFDPYVGLKERDPAGYLAARMANSVTGAVDMFNTWGTLRFQGPAYATDKQTGGPVRLIRDLGGDAHRFMDWVAANRAERLKAEDRENLFTVEDIAALKSLNKGKLDADYTLANGQTTRSREAAYVDALKRLDTANKNAQDLAVEAGLLKRDAVDQLWANPFYVPFYRQAEDGNTRSFAGGMGGFTGQTAGKKLKGGTEKLNADLWENAFGNWSHMIDASIRNKTANQVLDTAATAGIAKRITAQQHDAMSKAERAETVWTMVDGEKVHWRVEDPFTLKAITALDYVQSSAPLMGIGRAAKKLLQVGVAASPIFQVRNLIRDTENSIAVSPIAKNVFRNLYDGARQQDIGNGLQNVARAIAGRDLEQARISQETADAVAGGATMRYAAGVDTSFRKSDSYLDSESKIGKFWDYFRRNGQAATEAMGFGENMNRLALYRQLGEEGAPHELRAYEGRDLSDFTLVGASPIIRHIVELVPYMNAWMQGLYKVGRAAADSDKNVTLAVGGKVSRQIAVRLAFVTAGMTALNLALDAIYSDDPDYRNRNEYDRNSNFWFKVGDTEFRIPMGFEVAALSRMAAIWTESLYDKDMTAARAWKNTLSILGTQMGMNPIPQAVKPLYDLAANETRTGAPIETQGMERLRPEFRSAPETTLVAQGVSEVANKAVRAVGGPSARAFSPVQLDYLVQAYAGWLGTSALQIADQAVRAVSSEPEKPAKDMLGKLTGGIASNERTSERGSGFYVNQLYQQGDAIKEAYATFRDLSRRGRDVEAKEYLVDNKDAILKYPAFDKVMKLEGEINGQIKIVTDDPKLSGEQKRVKIMRLNSLKNRAAEGLFTTGASP